MVERLAAAIVIGNLLIVVAAALEFVFRAYWPALVLLVVGVVIFIGGTIASYYMARLVSRNKSSP